MNSLPVDKQQLFIDLAGAEYAMDAHLNAAQRDGLSYRLNKLAMHPWRYLRLGLTKLGILPQDAWARTFFDFSLSVPLTDINAADLYYAGSLRRSEGYVSRFMLNEVNKETVFYDIGANYGFYSALALRLDAYMVYAVEPSHHCLKYLQQSFRPWSGICSIEKIALGARAEILALYDSSIGGKSGFSTLSPRRARTNRIPVATYDVNVETLNRFTRFRRPPTLIKIDTEGFEGQIILGGQETLNVYSPTLIVELWGNQPGRGDSQAVVRYLKKLGYRPHRIRRDGRIELCIVDFDRIGENNNFVFKKV